MSRTTRSRLSLFLLSLLYLAACGGGGSGNGSGDGPNPVPTNAAPTSDAGADATVNEQTAVTLTGSGADSDGSVTSYSWTQVSGTAVSLSDADTVSATFDAPITTSQLTLTFRLTVTDNEGATGSDTVSITVDPVNASPTALAGDDEAYPEGSFFNLSGMGSDTDGTIVSGAWTQVSGSPVIFESPNELQTGVNISAGISGESLVFQLEVTDNEGATATDEKSVIVEAALPFVNYTGDADPDPLTDVVINLVDAGNSQLVPATNSVDGYTTIVVNSTDTYNFLVADESLTLTGTGAPAIAVGDIIVGILADESGGYVREVTAISGDVLSTTAASLSDAFPNAELNLSISLSNDVIATTTSVKNSRQNSSTVQEVSADILNFNRTLQYEIVPGVKTVTELSMNSQLTVDLGLSILQRSITEMSTVVSANYLTAAYLDVDLQGEYSRNFEKTFKPIFDKTAVITVGVVPVLVNVKAVPVVGAGINMSASGSLKYGFRVGGELRSGFQYRDSAITDIAEFAPLMNKIGPDYTLAGGVNLNAQASVGVIVTLYDINVSIPAIAEFEFSGPGVGIDLGPNANFSVDAVYDSQATPPLNCALDLSVGISSNLDIEYGTIGSQLGIENPKSISLYNRSDSLWSSSTCPFSSRTGNLTGSVTDSADMALGDVSVQVENDSGTVIAETLSAGSGQYQIDEIAIGSYDVVYSKQDYKQAVANLIVPDGGTVDLPVALVRDGVGTLRISVIEEGVPATLLADVSVIIREGLNNPTGSFVTREFSATTPVDVTLDAGYYTLEVEKDGFDSVIESVSVDNGDVVNITIEFPVEVDPTALDLIRKTATSVITSSTCPDTLLGWNYSFTETTMTLTGTDGTQGDCIANPEETFSLTMANLDRSFDIPFNCVDYPICTTTDLNKRISGIDESARNFTSTYSFNPDSNILIYEKSADDETAEGEPFVVTFTEVISIVENTWSGPGISDSATQCSNIEFNSLGSRGDFQLNMSGDESFVSLGRDDGWGGSGTYSVFISIGSTTNSLYSGSGTLSITEVVDPASSTPRYRGTWSSDDQQWTGEFRGVDVNGTSFGCN